MLLLVLLFGRSLLRKAPRSRADSGNCTSVLSFSRDICVNLKRLMCTTCAHRSRKMRRWIQTNIENAHKELHRRFKISHADTTCRYHTQGHITQHLIAHQHFGISVDGQSLRTLALLLTVRAGHEVVQHLLGREALQTLLQGGGRGGVGGQRGGARGRDVGREEGRGGVRGGGVRRGV